MNNTSSLAQTVHVAFSAAPQTRTTLHVDLAEAVADWQSTGGDLLWLHGPGADRAEDVYVTTDTRKVFAFPGTNVIQLVGDSSAAPPHPAADSVLPVAYLLE